MVNIEVENERKLELKSLGDLLRRSCQQYRDKPALLVPEKDTFRTVTYKELWEWVKRYASGLRALGLRRGDRICILSENSAHWAVLDWACQVLGIIVAPIYPTLPPEQVAYIVENSEAKFVFCGDMQQLAKVAANQNVQARLLTGSTKENQPSSFEVVANEAPPFPEDEFNRQIDEANGDDIATFIYTSGTTGLPKGVMLCHKSFIWMNEAVSAHLPLTHEDTFFTVLPLSHVFGRANDHFLPISLGATIGYCRSVASLGSDMLKVQPTVVLVVPRLLDAVKERIENNIKTQKPLNQILYSSFMRQGKKKARGQFAPLYSPLYALVGIKIKNKLSPRLRFMVSGGAALPRDLFDFFFSIGIPIQQGYGLTETTSGIYVNNPNHENCPDTVGEPLIGVETKIDEDGEILFRGPFVMKGYYKLPEETSAAIDKDGWFHTGDIGELEGTRLRITDRKKDLIVLGNGKNVAPQMIEGRLKEESLIVEAVVLGDGEDSCFALILPNYDRIREELQSKESDQALAKSLEAKKLVKAAVQKVNKSLAGYEAVKRFALLEEKFSIEAGELTPTLKVKRKVITEKYAGLISNLLSGHI